MNKTWISLLLSALLFPSGLRADKARLENAKEVNVAVPMRDGVVLRADVFHPGGPEKHPVLLIRTPYDKDKLKPDSYLKAGYIVVRQDARGRYASEGKWESFYRSETHDATDGYDTVEWAAKLPDSSGKVGTFGISYNAFLQWRLAPLRPPSLVAMSACSIPPRLTQLEGPGTIRPGRRLNWFYCGMSPDMRGHSGAEGVKTAAEAGKLWKDGEGDRWLHFLPWLDLPKLVFEDEDDAVKDWLRAPSRDPWRLIDGCPEISVPNLDIVGWFDHCNDGIEIHQAMRRSGKTEAARNGQRLVIGPWSHTGHGNRKVGTVDFGPAAKMDIAQTEIRYFDHWLKGEANGVERDAPVKIFVMGANRWRDEQEWPPARAKAVAFYLDGRGHANTPVGDGKLSRNVSEASQDTYRYDPRDPVPTLWSSSMFTIPADQAPLAQRRDILVYQSEPLAAPLEVTGYPEVILHAASSAPDTDFFAKLVDVAPDGTNRDISSGMVRARYREGLERSQLLKPGEIVEYHFKLRPTSNEFQKGHRIRVDVTSSDFPNYDRNHNTAADPNTDATLDIAEQVIHHGGSSPSRIMLPVIDKGEARQP
ncbi:MAG TPA: CocE/NonD family hydrolase [Verrucomicrobiaceae bacterium]